MSWIVGYFSIWLGLILILAHWVVILTVFSIFYVSVLRLVGVDIFQEPFSTADLSFIISMAVVSVWIVVRIIFPIARELRSATRHGIATVTPLMVIGFVREGHRAMWRDLTFPFRIGRRD